jgi:hypothetical protein
MGATHMLEIARWITCVVFLVIGLPGAFVACQELVRSKGWRTLHAVGLFGYLSVAAAGLAFVMPFYLTGIACAGIATFFALVTANQRLLMMRRQEKRIVYALTNVHRYLQDPAYKLKFIEMVEEKLVLYSVYVVPAIFFGWGIVGFLKGMTEEEVLVPMLNMLAAMLFTELGVYFTLALLERRTRRQLPAPTPAHQ